MGADRRQAYQELESVAAVSGLLHAIHIYGKRAKRPDRTLKHPQTILMAPTFVRGLCGGRFPPFGYPRT